MIEAKILRTNAVRTGLALGFIALSTAGCAGIGKAIGGGKNPPDEFAIATKAPSSCRRITRSARRNPANRGRRNFLLPSARVRCCSVMRAPPPTVGEQQLLQQAGATVADPNIRAVLDAENGGRAEKDRSFANQLMFWKFVGGDVDDAAAPLQVDDPEAWHAERKRAIENVTGENSEVTIKNDDALLLPGVF